ncbi:MAG: 5'-methylthioadenosine/S-adenosylhomocysteine nucleosidase [Vibrionaceae bacterium]
MIAIIGAMQQEVSLLKEQLQNCHSEQIAGCHFFSGELAGKKVVLLQSGIGKVAAALGTAILLDRFAPKFVINTGSAGGLDAKLNLGDVVISTQVAYHDVDVRAFGYAMGQMAGQPPVFVSDERLVALAQKALAAMPNGAPAYCGLICTGDAFVHSHEQQAAIRHNFSQPLAVEMEAAAIAQTCHQFNVPFVVVRAISDVADKASPMTFEQFLPLAAKSSSEMVMQMLLQLAD